MVEMMKLLGAFWRSDSARVRLSLTKNSDSGLVIEVEVYDKYPSSAQHKEMTILDAETLKNRAEVVEKLRLVFGHMRFHLGEKPE